MFANLIFSIDQELRNGEVFLIVHLQEKGSSRIIYLSDLKKVARCEKGPSSELILFLIAEHCKSSGISATSSQADTLAANKIRIRSSHSLQAFEKLIASKKFSWKGRSVFFNPMTRCSISLNVQNLVNADGIILSGFLHMDKEKFPFSSVDFLFLGKPIWGICEQMVFVLPLDIRSSWVNLVYPESKCLQGKEKERFIEDFQEDPPEGFPDTMWEGISQKQDAFSSIQVLPVLLLKDTRGSFANLSMQYGEKNVAFHDPCLFEGRDIAAEKSWENDLLETDFIAKIVGSSHYYCPLDKVASSLSFLLEIGWKIYDHKGRRVMKTTGSDVELLANDQGVLLKGKVCYGEHEASLQNVVGAFNRREQFVEISPQTVGLLDSSAEYEGLQDLTEIEQMAEGCLFKKKQWGLLESFSRIPCDIATRSLMDRLQSLESQKEETVLERFRGDLRAYQKTGVEWLLFLYAHQLSGLLADEMGLGKTVQVLAFLSQIQSKLPVLIVVPTSLVFNWKKEWGQFVLGKQLYIHEGRERTLDPSFLQKQEAVLVSYALLRSDWQMFRQISFACIVLDEAQWIKNPESQLAKACYELSAQMKICLTGTPVENRVDDLWSLFHFLEPELLGSRSDFLQRLATSQLDGRYAKQIRKLIRPFILRRMKEDVAEDLPEKIEQVVWVEMQESQRSLYENWLIKTRQGLLKKISLEGGGAHRMEILETILRLRQICAHPYLVDSEGSSLQESAKWQRVLEDLEEVVQEGRKVLVYSQFTQMLKLFKRELDEKGFAYAYLDGETKDRETAVSSFQNDPKIQIFLISLKAGGVGLNLTSADYVFLFDPWWNEAVEKQAIDRAHRLGRKGAVIARRYIVAESIEEKMMKLKEHKKSLAKGLLELEESSLGLEEMIELLR